MDGCRKTAAVFALVLLMAGCEKDGHGERGSGFLRLAGRDDVPTLDPAIGYDTVSWLFEDAIFNTLLDYDEESELLEELAESWHMEPGGLVYRFRLRPDIRFSHGRPLVARDVKYSIERVLDPATRSPGAEFFGSIAGAELCRRQDCSVSGIRTRGDREIEFHLREVDPLFPHKLAMQFAAVVPREEVERWGEDFSRHVVGSGPFQLRQWSSGQRLVLVRNPNYFVLDVPRLPGIEYLMGVDEELAWFKYEAGELDVTDIPPAEFPRVTRSSRYEPLLHKITAMTTMYLGMNCEMAPFDDVRVRRAVNHAVNKDKLLRLINRRGVEARGVLPPTMPGYQPALSGYPYDPQRAKELLSEAGYASGFRTTLWIRVDDDAFRLAQSVQQDLREVGIEVSVRALTWGPFLDKVKTRGQVPFFSLGWQADFPDSSNFLETLFHSKSREANNSTFFSDASVDALLDRAARTIDSEERMDLLRRAERLVVAAAPWVFLFHPVSHQLVQPWVRNYRLHALRPPRLDAVWIEPRVRAEPPPAGDSRALSVAAPPAS